MEIIQTLVDRHRRALVGYLVEERALTSRLDTIRAESGPDRPELHDRLHQVRRDLRALAATTVIGAAWAAGDDRDDRSVVDKNISTTSLLEG